MLNKLSNVLGSRKRRKRVGRGPGSTSGKTCGRGHKGQKSRSGSKKVIGFEGGQMPIHRRLPKRGFTNIFRKEYRIVNLRDIESNRHRLDLSGVLSLQDLERFGLINNRHALEVKLLGDGQISLPLKIQVHTASKSARKKIEEAGGQIVEVAKPEKVV